MADTVSVTLTDTPRQVRPYTDARSEHLTLQNVSPDALILWRYEGQGVTSAADVDTASAHWLPPLESTTAYQYRDPGSGGAARYVWAWTPKGAATLTISTER